MDRKTFIQQIGPLAIKHGRPAGVLPSLIVAQGCLESDNGTSELAVNANNLFGIKKGGGWTGAVYAKSSKEWSAENGWYDAVSEFRKYASIEDSIKDLVAKYTGMTRYATVIGQTDFATVAQTVKDAGYATDPTYPAKLQAINEAYQLEEGYSMVVHAVNPEDITVGIDLGHGSNTYQLTGGKGVERNGKIYEEHDFNSRVGILLQKRLEGNGFKTFLPQKPYSPEVSLNRRKELYKEAGCDLIISVHANGNYQEAVNGACAFYWITDSNSKAYAQRAIDEMKKAGYDTHGNGLHVSESGSWTNLFMCREVKATLVEHGFMTNNEEFEQIFLNKGNYAENMAEVHHKAVCRHFDVPYRRVLAAVAPAPVARPKWYRIRKAWADGWAGQIAAFPYPDVEEALAFAVANPGYKVYDNDGKEIPQPVKEEPKPEPKPEPKEEPKMEKPEERYEPVTGTLGEEWAKAVEAGITDGSNPYEFAKRVHVGVMIVRNNKKLIQLNQMQNEAAKVMLSRIEKLEDKIKELESK